MFISPRPSYWQAGRKKHATMPKGRSRSLASDTSAGVAQTFVVLGVAYFISMSIGALAIRVPAPDWKPAGWTPPVVAKKLVSNQHVHIDQALKTPQFYLIWLVLFLNVTAGIGILGQASVMIQESFKDTVTAGAAAGFVGLLSLFNMGGRFVWASASDWVGRSKGRRRVSVSYETRPSEKMSEKAETGFISNPAE